MSSKQQPSFTPGRRWSIGFNVVLIILLVFSVVVMVNYLRSRSKLVGLFEDLLHPIFSNLGLFTLDHDLPNLLEQNGAQNIRIEPTSFLKTHHIISFNVPA